MCPHPPEEKIQVKEAEKMGQQHTLLKKLFCRYISRHVRHHHLSVDPRSNEDLIKEHLGIESACQLSIDGCAMYLCAPPTTCLSCDCLFANAILCYACVLLAERRPRGRQSMSAKSTSPKVSRILLQSTITTRGHTHHHTVKPQTSRVVNRL